MNKLRGLITVLAVSCLFLGCPPRTFTVPDVTGQTQAAAETAITDASLSVGTVTQEYSSTVAAGTVISQNPPAGTEVDSTGSAVALVVSRGTLAVQGQVLFDDGNPVVGASAVVSVGLQDAAKLAQLELRKQAALNDWTRPDAKSTQPAPDNTPSAVSRLMAEAKQQSIVTDAEGGFSFEVTPATIPARVLVEVSYDADPLPVLETSKWGDVDTFTNTFDMGVITVPNPQGADVPLAGGGGQTSDGSIVVEDLPAEIDTFFARSYDPDDVPEVFPGEFSEMGTVPLNSTVFMWMEALDVDGNPVDDLAQAATIRSQVPRAQWIDLEDISAGTDYIEIPIYTYDEELSMWDQEGIGWLEDANRTVLPEDAESVILDGTFAGEVFATFTTDHFSWMNVDYAFIGPWTLSRMSRENRNTDCLFNAMQLAKKIALSASGRAAYARVNQADADLAVELGDGKGPELKDVVLAKEYGVYKGDSGGSEDQFEIASGIWDGCGPEATEDQKKNTTLIMAVTILHETAHWKDDVKKNPDDDTDTDGEEGNQLEKDLFGGIITGGAGGLQRDGKPVTTATRDGWLNAANWPAPGGKVFELAAAPKQAPALEVTIELAATAFELGEEIPVVVTYRNVSSSPIEVLNDVVLEGWPLYFDITRQSDGERVRFLGDEVKLNLADEDFDTLEPNATLTQTVNLLRDPDSAPRYQLIGSGTYDITAVYESFRGVDEAASNTLTITVSPGGSLSGTVTNATDGFALAGATVSAIQNGFVLTSVTTDASGNYSIPELPAGTYALEIQASGFLRSSADEVQVTAGENAVVSLSLSPLLALGELRLVLTWGGSPRDLDSHLWLPIETPYHIYYSRPGNLDDCPFALLDVDDTYSFGPETITIRERFLQGTYVYSINNYSGSPSLTESEAQVQVFDSTGLIATLNVPTEGEGLFWNVLSIDGATGAITEINTLGGTPEPYPDTTIGCEAPATR